MCAWVGRLLYSQCQRVSATKYVRNARIEVKNMARMCSCAEEQTLVLNNFGIFAILCTIVCLFPGTLHFYFGDGNVLNTYCFILEVWVSKLGSSFKRSIVLSSILGAWDSEGRIKRTILCDTSDRVVHCSVSIGVGSVVSCYLLLFIRPGGQQEHISTSPSSSCWGGVKNADRRWSEDEG